MTSTPWRRHILTEPALTAWAATTLPRARATCTTAASSSSVMTVDSEPAPHSSKPRSPETLTLNTSTPSRAATRQTRRKASGEPHVRRQRHLHGVEIAEIARGCHLLRRRLQPRPRHAAGLDRALQHDVEPRLGRGGAEAAGEALVEHQLGVLDAGDDMLLHRN